MAANVQSAGGHVIYVRVAAPSSSSNPAANWLRRRTPAPPDINVGCFPAVPLLRWAALFRFLQHRVSAESGDFRAGEYCCAVISSWCKPASAAVFICNDESPAPVTPRFLTFCRAVKAARFPRAAARAVDIFSSPQCQMVMLLITFKAPFPLLVDRRDEDIQLIAAEPAAQVSDDLTFIAITGKINIDTFWRSRLPSRSTAQSPEYAARHAAVN